jgi:hypothetical protein
VVVGGEEACKGESRIYIYIYMYVCVCVSACACAYVYVCTFHSESMCSRNVLHRGGGVHEQARSTESLEALHLGPTSAPQAG